MNAKYVALACVVLFGYQLVPDTQQPPQVDRSKLISFLNLGAQNGTQQANMNSLLARRKLTWPAFVQQTLVPQMRWGVRRFLIHLPFGRDSADGVMSFDSYLIAQKRDLDVIWKGFARVIRPVVEGHYTDGNRVEVICYLGSLRLDPTFVELKQKAYAHDDWIGRFWGSIQPVLDAGCSLAFDTGATFPEDGPEYWAVGLIEALGTKVYIEGTALPAGYVAHLGRFSWAANHEQYWRNIADPDHGGTGQRGRWAQADQMSGEGILMISGQAAPLIGGRRMTPEEVDATYHTWVPAMIRRDLSAGFSVAVYVDNFRDQGMTLEDLIRDP